MAVLNTFGNLHTALIVCSPNKQDWQKKHELDRKAIQEVVCALCGQRQPVGTNCSACGVDFGAAGPAAAGQLCWQL